MRESISAGLLACLLALTTAIGGTVVRETNVETGVLASTIERASTIEPPTPTSTVPVVTVQTTTTTVVSVPVTPLAAEPVLAATPTTTAPPEPEPAPEPVTFVPTSDVEGVICEVFGEHCAAAIRVASCESGLNPLNVSGGRQDGVVALGAYHGLFQVGLPTHRTMVHDWGETFGIGRVDEAVFDPYVNAVIAHSLSRGGTTWTQHWPICGRQA